jgi:hypothetical protein
MMLPVASICLVSTLLGAPMQGPVRMSRHGRLDQLEGTWTRVVESFLAPDTSWVIRQPQQSLYLFTKHHYSMMYVVGSGQRRRFTGPEPTVSEKAAAYDLFRASAGTYEQRGSLLIVHPLVSRSPSYMAVRADTARFEMRGDTLLLTARYAWWRDRTRDVEDRIMLVRVRE